MCSIQLKRDDHKWNKVYHTVSYRHTIEHIKALPFLNDCRFIYFFLSRVLFLSVSFVVICVCVLHFSTNKLGILQIIPPGPVNTWWRSVPPLWHEPERAHADDIKGIKCNRNGTEGIQSSLDLKLKLLWIGTLNGNESHMFER